MDCIFCKIVQGELPAKIVFESEQVVAFEDINKVAPVHILIVPRRHLASITELSADDTLLLAAIQEAVLAVTSAAGVDQTGFRVVTNKGTSAGQSVFHLHVHVIGGRDLDLSLG